MTKVKKAKRPPQVYRNQFMPYPDEHPDHPLNRIMPWPRDYRDLRLRSSTPLAAPTQGTSGFATIR